MAAINPWFTGPGGTLAVTLTPQSLAANGTLSDGTPVTLTNDLENLSMESNAVLEEISGMSAARANNVLIQENTSFTLVEIIKNNGTNKLRAAAAAASYFKLAVTSGAQSWTYYGVRQSYSEALNRGKSTGTLVLAMIDPNTTNPALA